MNLEDLPQDVREDIEDQSLAILAEIRDVVIVIGGWGVRTHLGERHHRSTLDVDGVAAPGQLQILGDKLLSLGIYTYTKPLTCEEGGDRRNWQQFSPRRLPPSTPKKSPTAQVSCPMGLHEHSMQHHFTIIC